jgi:hypothetical protein
VPGLGEAVGEYRCAEAFGEGDAAVLGSTMDVGPWVLVSLTRHHGRLDREKERDESYASHEGSKMLASKGFGAEYTATLDFQPSNAKQCLGDWRAGARC